MLRIVEGKGNGVGSNGIFDRIIDFGLSLTQAEPAFGLRQQYLQAARMNRLTYPSNARSLRDVIAIVDEWQLDLSKERKDLGKGGSDLICCLQSRVEARAISGIGTAMVAVGVAGKIARTWMRKEELSFHIE